MKNDQKNPIYPMTLISCMIEQVKSTVYGSLNKWHLKCHVWSLNLNLWFKPTSFKLLLVSLTKITTCFHNMIMHHIVALHSLYFLSVAGNCSPSVDVVPTRRSMIPMKNCTVFRSARQAKPPCSFR